MSRPTKLLTAALSLTCLVAPAVYANSASAWRINGFMSQGLSSTSDNNYFGSSDDSISFDFFEAGLVVQKDISDTLNVSAKLAYRAPYSIQRHSTNIDHLLLDYHAFKGRDWYAGIRLGRIKSNYGLYNTARDTSYTWPTALMNDTIYTNKLLPLYLSADGINLYGHRDFTHWAVDLELSSGRTHVPGAVINDLFYGLIASEELTLKGIINCRFTLTSKTSGSRFNLTYLEADSSTRGFNEIPFTLREYALAWQQTWNHWELDLELYQANFGTDLDEETPTSRGYNITFHHLFPSGLDAYALIGEIWDDHQDKQGNDFEASTGFPRSIRYSANYGLGFVYPVLPHWDLAAEIRYNKGTKSLLFADNPPLKGSLKEHWSQLFIRVTYHF